MRALISVWDKTGVDDFARGLHELGFELVSSGGTATFLEERGLKVTRVEEVTAAPEILARRNLQEDLDTLAEHGIELFDLVCVNLYPFSSVASRLGVSEADTVE